MKQFTYILALLALLVTTPVRASITVVTENNGLLASPLRMIFAATNNVNMPGLISPASGWGYFYFNGTRFVWSENGGAFIPMVLSSNSVATNLTLRFPTNAGPSPTITFRDTDDNSTATLIYDSDEQKININRNTVFDGGLTLPSGAQNGYIMTSDAEGFMSWQAPSAGSGNFSTNATGNGVITGGLSVGGVFTNLGGEVQIYDTSTPRLSLTNSANASTTNKWELVYDDALDLQFLTTRPSGVSNVRASLTQTGDLTTGGNASVLGGLNVAGNITNGIWSWYTNSIGTLTLTNIHAGAANSFRFATNGTFVAGNNITATGDLAAGGDVTAGDDAFITDTLNAGIGSFSGNVIIGGGINIAGSSTNGLWITFTNANGGRVYTNAGTAQAVTINTNGTMTLSGLSASTFVTTGSGGLLTTTGVPSSILAGTLNNETGTGVVPFSTGANLTNAANNLVNSGYTWLTTNKSGIYTITNTTAANGARFDISTNGNILIQDNVDHRNGIYFTSDGEGSMMLTNEATSSGLVIGYEGNLQSRFNTPVSGSDPVNAQDFVTKAYGDANYGGGSTTITNRYVQTNITVVANTATETSLTNTGTGTLAIPANYLQPGTVIRFTASGFFSSIAGGQTVTFNQKLGNTIVCSGTLVELEAANTNHWSIVSLITVQTNGANGGVVAGGTLSGMNFSSGVPVAIGGLTHMAKTNSTTIDTTTALVPNLTATWGTADPGNSVTCQQLFYEVLKP